MIILGIILSVLKVIGIVLLIILLVILALLALILFAPIVYEGGGDSVSKRAALRLKWLGGLLSFRLRYMDGDTGYGVYLFGIRLQKPGGKKKKKRTVRKKEDTRTEETAFSEEPSEERETDLQTALSQEEMKQTEADVSKETVTQQHQKTTKADGSSNKKKPKSSHRFKKKKSSKIPGSESKVQIWIGRLKFGISIFQKLREGQIFSYVFVRLQKLLYRIRPRKLKGCLSFGFSDPSTCGLVCSVASAVPFIFGSDLILDPDFYSEEAFVEGNAYVKGRIHVIHVVIFLIAMIRKKEIRQLISMVRKGVK